MLGIQHPLAGQAGVRPRELGGGAERFQDRHRGLGRGYRIGAPAQRLQCVGHVAQRTALMQTVPGLTPQRQRLLAGVDGALEPADQHQLVGQPVIQPGDHGRVSIGGKTQGALELRSRLPA